MKTSASIQIEIYDTCFLENIMLYKQFFRHSMLTLSENA